MENNGEKSWSDKGNPSYCRKFGSNLKKGHFHLSKQFFRSVNICSVPGEKKNQSVDIFAIIENNGEESWSDKGKPSYCRKCGFTLFRKWMNLPY